MLELRVNQFLAGQEFTNVFNITGSQATAENADAIATAVVNCWATGLLSRLTDAWAITNVQYREYPAVAGAPFFNAVVPSLPLAGLSNTTTMEATHTAMRCNTFNNTAPPYTGSYFIGGWTNGNVLKTGVWRPEAVADVATMASALLDIGATTGLDVALGIRSRGTASIAPDTTSVVQQIAVSTAPASLDSRRYGQGS